MKLFFITFLLTFSISAKAQVVSTEPAKPTADKEVTLIFDLDQAADPRTKKLLGKTDDVYLWGGAGTTEDGSPFEYRPADQKKFSKPYPKGKMTYLGGNKWSITLIPRTYFGVPENVPVKKLGLLLKSGNGRAQTEDIIVDIL